MQKVLLVDDVKMFVDLQKHYLELSALKLLTAENGMEALEICRKHRPALVFMDLNMPVMDGASCCRAVKDDRTLKETKIVLITSEGKPVDRDRCFEAGCDDFLTKPLDRLLFLETARRHLPIVERRNRRVNCRIKANYRAHGATYSGTIVDLSKRGFYLATDCEPKPGTQLDMVFALPGVDGAIIQTKGEVAWLNTKTARNKPGLPEGFGMKIVEIDPRSDASLSHFVDAESNPTEPVWRFS